jgi:hypothetical protein
MKKLSTYRVNAIARNEALPTYMRQAALDELRARREAKQQQKRETDQAVAAMGITAAVAFNSILFMFL